MSLLPRKSIVVPVDYSASSAPAVRTALETVDEGGVVHVLNVIPPLEPLSPLGIFGDGDVESKLSERAKTHLESWLSSREIEGVTASIAIGQEGDAIVDFAAEKSADLIIIPSHGHSGLKRVLLGSVAERVLRHAHCPILVLRRGSPPGAG